MDKIILVLNCETKKQREECLEQITKDIKENRFNCKSNIVSIKFNK